MFILRTMYVCISGCNSFMSAYFINTSYKTIMAWAVLAMLLNALKSNTHSSFEQSQLWLGTWTDQRITMPGYKYGLWLYASKHVRDIRMFRLTSHHVTFCIQGDIFHKCKLSGGTFWIFFAGNHFAL